VLAHGQNGAFDRAPRGRDLSVREGLTRIIVDWSGIWQAARLGNWLGRSPATKAAFGWKRRNRRWLYDTLRLFNCYRVRRDTPEVARQGRSHKPWNKMGERSAGNPPAAFDVEGTGNVAWSR
jgi:hypothetical protein